MSSEAGKEVNRMLGRVRSNFMQRRAVDRKNGLMEEQVMTTTTTVMQKNKRASRRALHKSGRRWRLAGLLMVLVTGSLLLGACAGGLPSTTASGHSHQTCHSLVACLSRKVASRLPTIPASHPASPGSAASQPGSQPANLGPEALGPLSQQLSAANQQVLLGAMDMLSPGAASAVTARLSSLSSSGAARLGADLTQAFAANPRQAPAYADALVGIAGASVPQAVAADEMQAFSAGFESLPGALSQGNTQVASFISQILSTTVPHIEAMMQTALSQVPAQQVPLLLADADRGLQAATANPENLGDLVAVMEDPTALALSERAAYQAGYDCGAALMNTCTSFDRWMLSVAGLKTAPAIIQQDVVDCIALPLCTQTDYQGIISWVDQVAASSASSAAFMNGLSAEMEANSLAATESWMGAF